MGWWLGSNPGQGKEDLDSRLLFRDFPGGPVAKILHSQCRGPEFGPWSGNQIPTGLNERSHMLQRRLLCGQRNNQTLTTAKEKTTLPSRTASHCSLTFPPVPTWLSVRRQCHNPCEQVYLQLQALGRAPTFGCGAEVGQKESRAEGIGDLEDIPQMPDASPMLVL